MRKKEGGGWGVYRDEKKKCREGGRERSGRWTPEKTRKLLCTLAMW